MKFSSYSPPIPSKLKTCPSLGEYRGKGGGGTSLLCPVPTPKDGPFLNMLDSSIYTFWLKSDIENIANTGSIKVYETGHLKN